MNHSNYISYGSAGESASPTVIPNSNPMRAMNSVLNAATPLIVPAVIASVVFGPAYLAAKPGNKTKGTAIGAAAGAGASIVSLLVGVPLTRFTLPLFDSYDKEGWVTAIATVMGTMAVAGAAVSYQVAKRL